MKRCSCCKEYLDEDQFSFKGNKLQTFCKDCQKAYSKTYREKNKERCRKNLQDWRLKNKK
jgi:hypothetical protein